jgi:hypothetical protein
MAISRHGELQSVLCYELFAWDCGGSGILIIRSFGGETMVWTPKVVTGSN